MFDDIIVRGKTVYSLLRLLERTEDMRCYFEHIDRYTVDRRHLEFWIGDIIDLWDDFEKDYDNESHMNDVLYQLSVHRFSQEGDRL